MAYFFIQLYTWYKLDSWVINMSKFSHLVIIKVLNLVHLCQQYFNEYNKVVDLVIEELNPLLWYNQIIKFRMPII